jgi:hypothetical protein
MRILVCGFLCALACSLAPAQSKDHSANGLILKGAFTPARAMELIYKGAYNHFNGSSEWTPNQTRSYPDSWPDKIDVAPLFETAYVESEVSKHLLVTWARPQMHYEGNFSCHQCRVLIGLALFANEPEGWRVESSDLQFGYYGAGGQPPSVSLQPLGPSRYGLLIHEADDMSGEAWKWLTVASPQGGKFLKVFAVKMADSWPDVCSSSDSNERVDDCFAYDGDIAFFTNPSSPYYDMLLTKRTYRSSSKKHPVGTSIARYRFDGSRYVPAVSAKSNTAQSPK